MEPPSDSKDLISELPDDCLALILQRVKRRDIKSCNLVCRKWLFLRGSNRRHLFMLSEWISITSIPFLFSRFDSVTKLVIICQNYCNEKSLSDEELELISIKCSNLTTLKLLYSDHVTDVGMAALGTLATRLKKLSCHYCGFGTKPLNALLSRSSSLEVISIQCLGGRDIMLVYPGAAASSLKSIRLLDCYSIHKSRPCPQWFAPLLTGSKNLTSLKIHNCYAYDDWGDVMNMVSNRDNNSLLEEVYLYKVQVSDFGISALSNFSKLEILHVTSKFPIQILNDQALSLISTKCRNLMTFKLRNCHLVTHVGMAALGRHATRLKKFSCRNCKFGAKGLNALVSCSSSLQEISVKGLRVDSTYTELIYPCAAGCSLKSISLKDLYDNHWPQCFAPLMTGLKNLTSLTLFRCLGSWDHVLNVIANGENSLFEVYLNKVKVTDDGLSALCTFSKLEILHLIATPNCTNACILSVVKQCKLLRWLHIDNWRMKWSLGEDGLFSVGKNNAKLQVVKHRKKINPLWQTRLM